MQTYLLFFSVALAHSPSEDRPYDVDGPCQVYVEKFAEVQASMVKCASLFSIPPKVCTNCVNQYMIFKQVEYELHHLDNVTSRDNRSCTAVIYDSYLLSYNYEISEAITSKIWDNSRCESCIHIEWNFPGNDSRVAFLNHTINFETRLFNWRNCIENYTGYDDLLMVDAENGTICAACKKEFDSLFEFYWDIYIRPGVEFCIDVETTMNDTFHIWNDVWRCADRKDRDRDSLLVILTSFIMAILIVVFYTSSFVQGGGVRRHLVQYSRMDPPRGQRSRLLSTSASDSTFPQDASFVNPVHEPL